MKPGKFSLCKWATDAKLLPASLTLNSTSTPLTMLLTHYKCSISATNINLFNIKAVTKGAQMGTHFLSNIRSTQKVTYFVQYVRQNLLQKYTVVKFVILIHVILVNLS